MCSLPVSVRHTMALLSKEAVQHHVPLGWKATALTLSVWPEVFE